MTTRHNRRRWFVIAAYVLWLAIAFIGAQLLLLAFLNLIVWLGVPIGGINTATLQLVVSAAAYVLALLLTIYVPKKLKNIGTSLTELGVSRWPKFSDIGLGVIAFIPYALVSFALVSVVKYLYAGFDDGQTQNVGFENLTSQFDYMAAFLALVVIAPIAEEMMFRGYLYGKLRARTGMIVSIIATSLLFAVLHLQLNVGIDVFALSIILCLLRETTGSIWAGALLHMLKNGIAFYFLFVNPMLIQ